jgi:L-threonylcarbamoyladenylate synthase
MEPNILRMPDAPPDPELLARVTQHLEGGGLVAMPTETVYGFGSALQEEPLLRLARMKARSTEKPFLVLVPGVNSVRDLHWPPKALALAEVFWPGALTLVLRDEEGLFPPGVRSPGGSVAIRQSPHPLARAVVEALGAPVVSTSANPPGKPPALSAQEAWETARGLGAGEELWVLDAGTLDPSDPSTIVDCTGEEPVVLRTGSIPVNRIRCVLPDLPEPH